jgi:hypothetical protein
VRRSQFIKALEDLLLDVEAATEQTLSVRFYPDVVTTEALGLDAIYDH